MTSPHLSLFVLAVLNVPVYYMVYLKFFDDLEELEGALWARADPIPGAAVERVIRAVVRQSVGRNQADGGVRALRPPGVARYGTVKDHAPAIVRWLDQAW